jgi:cell shape-determining protein MreC
MIYVLLMVLLILTAIALAFKKVFDRMDEKVETVASSASSVTDVERIEEQMKEAKDKYNHLERLLYNFKAETSVQLSNISSNADPNFINQSFDI